MQVVVDLANFDEEMLKLITTGACLSVNGVMVESVGSGQKVEVQAREIEVLGTCDNTYPLQKKGHSMEFLREIAHLRPRTNTFGAVFRIRHNMAIAIHRSSMREAFSISILRLSRLRTVKVPGRCFRFYQEPV